MELYKEKNIKPLSGVLLLIIQLPILIALISIFYKISPIHPEYLYSFVAVPTVKLTLFGISIAGKSIILSLITGIAQFFQLHFSIAARQQKAMALSMKGQPKPTDFASQLSGSMTNQMKFFLPVIAFASTYWIIPAKFPQAASIIAIYWSISALFTLGQELYIRKRHLGQ